MLKGKNKAFLKPREAKNALKKEFVKRTAKLRASLPHNWKLLFIHDNKEYTEHSLFLTNVMSARSMHLETLEKIEKWAKTLNK